MTKFFRNNGLTIVLMLLFLASIIGQLLTGWRVEAEDLVRHGKETVSLTQYAGDASFISAVFENWESEFLQMSAYVVLTAMLIQKGSSESKDPNEPPRDANSAASWLYAHSLGITLFLLFIASFVIHWTQSAAHAAEEAKEHGEAVLTTMQYLWDPQLWFESFQNWQSEFLSTAVLVVLSIFLRQRESPESKAVDDPNSKTGA
jgi:hypothetical protein